MASVSLEHNRLIIEIVPLIIEILGISKKSSRFLYLNKLHK